MHGNWFGQGFCGFGYNTFSIWNALIFVGLIFLIVGLLYYFINKRTPRNEALELLDLQFVNGKITEEDYLAKKQELLRK